MSHPDVPAQRMSAGRANQAVMALLQDHVPLTLLFDLARGDALNSPEIAHLEGGNADWLPAAQ